MNSLSYHWRFDAAAMHGRKQQCSRSQGLSGSQRTSQVSSFPKFLLTGCRSTASDNVAQDSWICTYCQAVYWQHYTCLWLTDTFKKVVIKSQNPKTLTENIPNDLNHRSQRRPQQQRTIAPKIPLESTWIPKRESHLPLLDAPKCKLYKTEWCHEIRAGLQTKQKVKNLKNEFNWLLHLYIWWAQLCFPIDWEDIWKC